MDNELMKNIRDTKANQIYYGFVGTKYDMTPKIDWGMRTYGPHTSTLLWTSAATLEPACWSENKNTIFGGRFITVCSPLINF
jgi:hypothetical protein